MCIQFLYLKCTTIIIPEERTEETQEEKKPEVNKEDGETAAHEGV